MVLEPVEPVESVEPVEPVELPTVMRDRGVWGEMTGASDCSGRHEIAVDYVKLIAYRCATPVSQVSQVSPVSPVSPVSQVLSVSVS